MYGKEQAMEMIRNILEMDFTDPYNLVPLLLVGTIAIYFIAIFLDQPPQ